MGYKFAYSTSLLGPDVVANSIPDSSDPVVIVGELLRPYKIAVQLVDGVYVIHRSAPYDVPLHDSVAAIIRGIPPIPELTVSASHYEILRKTAATGTFVNQQEIRRLPILGDDPLRSVTVLPGIAANDVSAKSYVRGSEPRNTGVILNGNELIEPYHVRNFQSLFSAIDSRAVDGIEVFSGNFPVQYGNHTGGMVILDTLAPTTPHLTELGLSVFNTSFLSTGTVADDRLGWLASARRGNLDLVIDKKYGEPTFSDFLGQLSVSLSDNATLSMNAFVADDNIDLVTESSSSEPEDSSNQARTAQFWINWQQQWSDSLTSITTLSINDFDNRRVETANDPEEMVANVNDNRTLTVLRLNQNWELTSDNDRHRLDFGLDMEHLEASYDYAGNAQYFGIFRSIDGIPAFVTRRTDLTLAGHSLGAYFSDQVSIGRTTVAQLGLRWDSQDYGNLENASQLSPRLSLAHAINSRTSIRASIGRYFQAQGIYELQVEDGVDKFFDAQRTDSATIGIQHHFLSGYSLRAEAYWKLADRVRPRFENVLNQLTVLPEFKPDRTHIAPIGFRAKGIELSVRREREDGMSWWATYVLSSADDEFHSGAVPRSWDQKHAVQVGLSVKGKRWNFGMVATAHSGWPKTSFSLDSSNPSSPTVSFSPRNQDRYSYFASLDMRVQYVAPVKVGKLIYFFDVTNAANRENECCIDFDLDTSIPTSPILQPETTNWLPLTPAIGVLWQF
jgi:hypothetical protein